MACYHPLKGYVIGTTPAGKRELKIRSYTTDHIEYFKGTWHDSYDGFISVQAERFLSEFIPIPCGRCIGCRLDYSKEWADRCLLELQSHEHSAFVTLTYDDDHLPLSHYLDEETGETGEAPTLLKRDVQLFMKRLRKRYQYDNHLMYYAAGEYGGLTSRPHYHIIIFGLRLDDLVFYKKSPQGHNYYNSAFMNSVWQDKGFVVVADVTWETCAYTARYVTKKLYGKEAVIYEKYNIEPEFALMSRRPGISRSFFDARRSGSLDENNNGDNLYSLDYLNIETNSGGRRLYIPAYYDRLMAAVEPERIEGIKDSRRQFIEDMNELKAEKTSLSYLEMLESAEYVKKQQVKALKNS